MRLPAAPTPHPRAWARPPPPPSPQLGVLPLPEELVAWTNLGALLLYVGCYQFSFGPISWLLCSEVMPLKVRCELGALGLELS